MADKKKKGKSWIKKLSEMTISKKSKDRIEKGGNVNAVELAKYLAKRKNKQEKILKGIK